MTQIADMAEGETTPMAPLVGEGPRHRRRLGRRVRHLRLAEGPRPQDRQDRLDRPQHRPRRRDARQAGDVQAVLRQGHASSGRTTWPEDAWKVGGAPVWGWMSYDPELDLVYYGVGNPAPYNPEQRPGDNKWTNSVLARRPSDGSLVWAYQFTPHDNWDYDATSTMILVDLKIGGKPRKVLVTFNKNGFQYTLDRATGEVLSASRTCSVNWAKSVDLKTGRPVLDPAKQTGASKGNGEGRLPEPRGRREPGSPAAYSPRTGLFYTSTNNLCMDFDAVPAQRIAGTPLHRRGHAVPPRARRQTSARSSPGTPATGKKSVGDRRSRSRPGAARWSRRATWRSTARSTAGSRRSTRRPARCSRSSRWAPASWATRSRTAAPTASSTWRCTPASAATRSCSPATSCRAIRPTCGRPADFMKDIGRHTSQGGIVWIFGL